MKHEEFGKKVGTAISELKQVKPQEIILVHHDDADGLCSGKDLDCLNIRSAE